MNRLTKKDYMDWSNGTGYYNQKQANQITEIEHKLGKLEDIMEKYNIESVEELDKRLMKIHNEWCCQEANLLKAECDRDAWKKACELAVETLRYELGRDTIKILYKDAMANMYGTGLKFDYEMSAYFYQQAKEKKNEIK